ncbi:MAG: hypothetical protein J6P73_06205 [Bacteroidales bacterium]|nr:hypothetical protein [Bacteroidales bacterium]
MKKNLFMLVAAMLFTVAASAQTYYVSKSTGGNRNDGSKDAPFKNLQKAIEAVPEGATIYVAEGNYFGTLDKGNIPVTKCVKIYGGYNADFSQRDVLKYRTMVQPNATSNGTASGLGTMIIKTNNAKEEVVIDGLLFDRGNSISYNAKGEGKPEGVDCPMMNPIGTSGKGGANLDEQVLTTETREIYFDNPTFKQITIRNCAFVNAPNYGIGGQFRGKAIIDNNIFINNRMIACDIWGGDANNNMVVEFCNNTVLFTWSRLKDMGDMGYAFRYNNRTDSYVHHNILGCSVFAALDRGRTDTPKDREAKKITTSEYNMFFLNKRGDLALPGGGLFMMVNCEDFEEVEQLKEIDGCVRLKDPSSLKGKINEAYLNGFINASYKESLSSDPNSPENQFRQAMGMNQTGTMKSSATMFANRYPFDDALKMFGAVSGYGAQLPK